MKRHPRVGSSLDSFLAEEGVLERAEEVAIKEAIAWQLREAIGRRRLTRMAVARRAGMTPAALDRLLAPNDAAVSLRSLHRAAAALGKKVRIHLADA